MGIEMGGKSSQESPTLERGGKEKKIEKETQKYPSSSLQAV